MPPNHPHMLVMPTSLEQPTVLTVRSEMLIMVLMASGQSAIQTTRLHPGLPLTMALSSLSNGLKYSTGQHMDRELEMSMSASRMSFRPLEARCSLAEPSLAILLDLALMGNTSSSQVKLNCDIIIDD